MAERLRFYLTASLIAATDVGTLFALSAWLGVMCTLLLVVVSTLIGLMSCGKLWHDFVAHCDGQLKQHGSPLPDQIKQYIAAEAALILVSMGLFIFPGLLSDVLAFLVLIPVVRGRIKDFVISVQQKNRQQEASASTGKGG